MANDLLKKIQNNQNAILTAKAAYNVAAKKKDKAAMDKAHKDADKARGYTTNTVKTGNGYVQSATKLTENKKQTPTLPVRTTGNPKLATPKPKEVKANQERNTQVLLKELNGKNGKTAAFIKGAALASVDPLGLHKFSKGEDPRVTKALDKKTNTVKSAPNASFAGRGFAVPKARTDKVKVETLGELAGSLAAVDVVGNAAIKGATKLGGKIINKLGEKAATETIPVVKNGVVKFEKVLKPTKEVAKDLKNVKLKAPTKGALPTKVAEITKPLPQAPIKAAQPVLPTKGTIPSKFKSKPAAIKKETQNISARMDDEYFKTVKSVEDYLNSYKPKGVDINLIPKNNDYGVEEFTRQNASKNDMWYQDFYKAHGRKPNKAELKELAEKLVENDITNPNGEFYNPALHDLIKESQGIETKTVKPLTENDLQGYENYYSNLKPKTVSRLEPQIQAVQPQTAIPSKVSKADYYNILSGDDVFIRTVRTPQKDIQGRISTPAGRTGIELGFTPDGSHTGVSGFSGKDGKRLHEWMAHEGWANDNVAVYMGKKTGEQNVLDKGEVEFNPTEIIDVVPTKFFKEANGDIHKALELKAQYENQAVQPQNTLQGAKLPQAQKVAENAPILPRFKDLGADVNKALPKSKISKFRENTIENSEMFQGTKEGLDPTDYAYNVVPEKESLAEAKQRLSADFNGEVEDLASKSNFDGVDMDTAMGIAKEYTREAQNTGDYTRLREWTKRIRERGTEGGQLIQAFAKYSRSPEGAIVEGQRVVDSVEKGIKKTNPNLINKVNSETKAVKDIIKRNQDDTIKSLGGVLEKELDRIKGTAKIPTPADKLAGKIATTTKMRSPREPDAINDMVNELFRSAKESPLPEAVAKAKRNPIQYLAEAIQNKAVYTETWDEAKNLIKAKYEGDNEVLSMLDDYFEKGIVPTYSNSTLNSSVRRSAKDLSIDLGKIIKQAKGDKETALRDITSYLVRETGSTGEDAVRLSNDVMAQYDAILKEKTESALKQMFKEVPKKGQKSTYEKVMELVNMGAYEDDTLRDIIKAKNNLPVLDNDDVKNILENMKNAETFPEGSYERKMFQTRAEQIISDKVPTSTKQKFAALQRMSLLINPKTLLTRNPLGNTVLGTVENLKDVPGAAIDKLVSLKTGQRTTTISPNLVAQAKGFGQGLKEWGKDIVNNVDTSPSRGQADLPSGRTFDNKFLHSMDQFLGRALQLGDRPFYQAAYNGRMAELEKLGVPSGEREELARLFALDRVFQNDSTLAKGVLKVRDTLGIPGRLLMPFAQTPANMMDKLLDYSPVGMAKAVSQLGTAGKGTFDQKLFVDRLARTFTGTGIAMLGYALAEKGILTGNSYDPTNKDKNAAETLEGKQGYSLKIGDKYYSFDWDQPIGGILAAAADAQKAGADEKDLFTSLGIGATAAANSVFNMSFMSGILDAFSGYSPAEGIGGALLSSTSQATPTVLNNVAKTIDPYARETYDPNMFKQQGNKLIARLPFASKTLPKKVDITGNQVQLNQGRGLGSRINENFAAPYKVTEVKKNTVNDEVLRLQRKTGDNGVLLNQAEKSISKNGTSYTLTTEEYQRFQREMGKEAVTNIEKLITTSKYKNMSTDEKAKALSDINKDAKHNAQNSILRARGVIDELSDMSAKQQANYKAIENDVTKKEFADAFNAQRKLGDNFQKDIYKAMQVSKLNPQKSSEISSALGFSDGTIERANNLVANNVTIKQFDTLANAADTSANGSITKDEAIVSLKNSNLTQEQKRAVFIAMCPSVKRIPF